jgi:hypothetical protein
MDNEPVAGQTAQQESAMANASGVKASAPKRKKTTAKKKAKSAAKKKSAPRIRKGRGNMPPADVIRVLGFISKGTPAYAGVDSTHLKSKYLMHYNIKKPGLATKVKYEGPDKSCRVIWKLTEKGQTALKLGKLPERASAQKAAKSTAPKKAETSAGASA